MIFRNILDLFDQYIPVGSSFLDHLRRFRVDARSLIRFFVPWYEMENKLPWLTLEVTNICNSKCCFCAYQYQDKFRHGRGVMSDQIFNKAINDFHHMGGKHVSFTPFAGDPLLDPKIIERIHKTNELGFWTCFFTNGIRLNHVDIEKLLKSGIDLITVSTAPLDRNMYELIYRNKHYDDVLQGLVKLFSARNLIRKNLNISIAFRSHIPLRQVLSLPDFKNIILPLMKPEDIKLLIVNTRGFDTWGGLIKPEDMVGIMRLALPPLLKQRPCVWTLTGLYVTWDGQVRACACRFAETENKDGIDDLYLGNIMEHSLEEIWVGERLKRLRRSFQGGNMPLVCRNCTMYRAC
jgi:radical SAM protein with 4Fe4S-binding SPASM domain